MYECGCLDNDVATSWGLEEEWGGLDDPTMRWGGWVRLLSRGMPPPRLSIVPMPR